MRRALSVAMLGIALSITTAGIARADVPPWPPQPSPAPVSTPFEQGRAVGRVIGFACGLGCCLAMPVIGGIALVVVSRRKKPAATSG